MAFVNLSLLLGGLFTAIPIVIHLMMRREPVRQVFPAFRFLQARRQVNRQRLQLKQWLLLALRVLFVLLIALAMARPTTDSAVFQRWAGIVLLLIPLCGAGLASLALILQKRRTRLAIGLALIAVVCLLAILGLLPGALGKSSRIALGDQRSPVAAVLVYDTAPRMAYRFDNRSRLEDAQTMGTWLLGQLPSGSQAAVIDARPGATVFSVDLSAAEKAVQRLQISGMAQPLPLALKRALQLAESSELERKEVYVMTDLSAAAWDALLAGTIRSELERLPDVKIYLVDMSVTNVSNVGLGELRLSAGMIAGNSPVEIEVEVFNEGPSHLRMLEVYVEQVDEELPVIRDGEIVLPTSELKDRQEVELAADEATRVKFVLNGLTTGVHHGTVRLTGSDANATDDTRHFTLEVQDAWPLLVVAPDGVRADFLVEAIAPLEYRETERERFDCQTSRPQDLPNLELQGFPAIALVDPEPLPPAVWDQLSNYVSSGGRLAIFLGRNADGTVNFDSPEAQKLIGGKLTRVWRSSDRSLFLAPNRYDHPILGMFRQDAESVPWQASPVYRHWVLDQLSPDASVVLPFSNGKPAILEHRFGDGVVVTMTTPVSDPLSQAGRQPWNELPTSEISWPYFVMVNELFLYLMDEAGSRLNYRVGDLVTLSNDPALYPERYQLFTPLDAPQEVLAHQGTLTVRFTEFAGAYRLKGFRGVPMLRGFSVNFPPTASRSRRIDRKALDQLLGEDRYRLATNRDEIEFEVGEGRVGREFYSYVMVVLVLIVGLEHLLANRFYQARQ